VIVNCHDNQPTISDILLPFASLEGSPFGCSSQKPSECFSSEKVVENHAYSHKNKTYSDDETPHQSNFGFGVYRLTGGNHHTEPKKQRGDKSLNFTTLRFYKRLECFPCHCRLFIGNFKVTSVISHLLDCPLILVKQFLVERREGIGLKGASC
jgi:hypothetical protein